MKIKSVLNIVFSVMFVKSMRKNNPHIIIHYKNLRANVLNWECMKYPCSRKDIDRFEELNSGLISVNLSKQFIEEERVIPDRTAKVKKAKYHVNPFMVEGGNNKYHYVLKELKSING